MTTGIGAYLTWKKKLHDSTRFLYLKLRDGEICHDPSIQLCKQKEIQKQQRRFQSITTISVNIYLSLFLWFSKQSTEVLEQAGCAHQFNPHTFVKCTLWGISERKSQHTVSRSRRVKQGDSHASKSQDVQRPLLSENMWSPLVCLWKAHSGLSGRLEGRRSCFAVVLMLQMCLLGRSRQEGSKAVLCEQKSKPRKFRQDSRFEKCSRIHFTDKKLRLKGLNDL